MSQQFEYDFEDIAIPVGKLTAVMSGTAVLAGDDPEYPGEFYVDRVIGLAPLHRGIEMDALEYITKHLESSADVAAWFANALEEGAPVDPNREHSTLNHAQTGVAA